MGITKQLTQFQIKDFEDWYNIHFIPTKSKDEETPQEIQDRNPYIPLAGEICGIIFQDDDELSDACPIIPDAYEQQERPFVMLKMGNGKDDLWRLPWTNIVNKDVVAELVTQLFTIPENDPDNPEGEPEDTGIIELINGLFERTTADWEQNDPNQFSYIKNRICHANYTVLSPEVNIIPKVEYDLINESIQLKDKNYYLCVLDEDSNLTNIIPEIQDMDKYVITLKNYITNKEEKYTNSLHLLGTAPTEFSASTTFWGLGNTSIFSDYLHQISEGFYNFSGEHNDEPFSVIFLITTDPDTFKQFVITLLYFEQSYVFLDPVMNIQRTQISVDHTEKCTQISPISAKWLPSSIKTYADWSIQSPGTPGYIKNKICSVLSYEDVNVSYISGEEIIIPEGYFGYLMGTPLEIIKNFGDINSYDKYRITYNDNKVENAQFLIIQDLSGEPIYTLGNSYLYINWIYNLALILGEALGGSGPPAWLIELLNSIEDTGDNICLIFSPEGNDVSVMAMIRPEEEEYQNLPAYVLNYQPKNKGKFIDDVTLKFENINLFDEIRKDSKYQYFLDENKQYYLIFDSNIKQRYLISSYNYNQEENATYLILADSPKISLNTEIDTTILREDAIYKLSLRKTAQPYQIQTIDPIWLPDSVKVGQYESLTSQEISAEIFNDYMNNKALGSYSHAEGYDTIASGNYQHVQGKRNIADDTSAFIIGNGDYYRSNAYKIDWNGNSIQSGQLEATEVKAGNHLLSNKEDLNNKVNIITENDKENNYPNSKAVMDYTATYIQNLLNISPDKDGNIVLEFTSIDGNGLYS